MNKQPFMETLQQALYGKSSNPFAEENVNDADFQRGYSDGERTATDEPTFGALRPAIWYKTFHEYGGKQTPEWTNWTRGFQAAQMAKITLK